MLAVKTDSEKGGEGMELTVQVPKHAQEILEQLNNHGFEAYVVGGCVRDSLLHRVPGDWDITTSARPEQVKAIFGHTIDTGLQHGTVTIMRDKVGYEVTTYRIDGEYEDGRHPKEVEFTSNLLEDLKRRDFTINAMAYNPKEGLVDGALYRGCLADSAGDPFFSPAWIFHRGKHLGGHQGDCSEPDPREQGADSGGVNEASVI